MTPELCRAFARYNRWMNDKVYAAASRLTDEERKLDRGAFFGSIHRTLNHLLVGDRIWLGRLAGVARAAGDIGAGGIKSLDQELAADFDDLRRERALTDTAIEEWAAAATEDVLAGPLRFIRKGAPHEVPLWWAVSQLFNHQTHHRGQVTTLLTQAGQDAGSTDLYAMLTAEAQRL